MAPGHEEEKPSEEELREFCNLGYAKGCGRLPEERRWDSVRFGVRALNRDGNDSARIQIEYVCEREYRPVEHGTLEFDAAQKRWKKQHDDPRVQRMAECFIAAQAEKTKLRGEARAAS